MGLFSWVKKHPWESALLGATAGLGGAGLAGIGPLSGLSSLLGGGAAAGAGGAALAGATEYGLGGAGESLLAAPAAGATALGLPATEYGLGGAGESAMLNQAPATGLAPQMARKFDPRQAMLLAQIMGAGQQPHQQLGAPMAAGNPMQRPAMASQEEIMKSWLLRNDPRTYARLYGQPQGVA